MSSKFVSVSFFCIFISIQIVNAQTPTRTPTPTETPTPTLTNTPYHYYVSPHGSNENPGTYDEPWETITYAVDKDDGQAIPGSIVTIMLGEYFYKDPAIDPKGVGEIFPIEIMSDITERGVYQGGRR